MLYLWANILIAVVTCLFVVYVPWYFVLPVIAAVIFISMKIEEAK